MRKPKRRKSIFPAVVSSGKYREFYAKEIHKTSTIQKQSKEEPKLKTIIVEESTSESNMDILYEDDLDPRYTEEITLTDDETIVVKYQDP